MSRFKIILLSLFVSTAALAEPTGIIPAVSDHYTLKPQYFHFDQLPAEKIAPGITRRFIMGTQGSLLRWDFKAGTHLPAHFHINEQTTRVEQGELIVYSQGDKYTLHAGDVMIFPPNVPHEFVVTKDTTIYEYHTPGRQDFINGDFEKMTKALMNKK